MDEFDNMREKFIDVKQVIKDDIKKQIEQCKSDLKEIKNHIEKKFKKSLSSSDDFYVTRKFIKYCTEFWLEEAKDHIESLSESKNCSVIEEIFNSLDKIQNLKHIPYPFNQLQYYKLLVKHDELIKDEEKKTFIMRFKKQSLMLIIDYIDSLEKELTFLASFIDFLCYFKNLQYIVTNLKLKEFCDGKEPFNELVNNILKLNVNEHGKNLEVLQEATICLQQGKNLFSIDTFKKNVTSLIQPIQIQEKTMDGRLIIEVIGKNIAVGDILGKLEIKLLQNPKIEEVRFVGGYVIHVDTNLQKEVWHGKNIAILTKTIKIYDNVIWDVSGKDNMHEYSSDAGFGEDGHGKQGKDGYPGESGGNVSILFEIMENAENLAIISNGGTGSKGQDGGNGRNGDDGKTITISEFQKKFPAVAKFDLSDAKKNIEKTIENIKKISTFEQNWTSSENMFIKTVTNQEGTITFSYQDNGWFSLRQAFLLYEGSIGQAGGNGGVYGLGGQGGYAGDIFVQNMNNNRIKLGISKNNNDGAEGENGKGGLCGDYGKNGLDIGYLDYVFWSTPAYHNGGHYKIHFSENSENGIWCPFKNAYANIILVNKVNKTVKKYEERMTIRQNSDRQHHAQAVKKKNILQESILESYSHYLNTIEKRALQNLRYNLENKRRLALNLTEKNQEQQKHSMKLKMKRQIHKDEDELVRKDMNEPSSDTTYNADYESSKNSIDKLKADPMLLENWLELKWIEPTRSELQDLFILLEKMKKEFCEKQVRQNSLENELKDIEQLLIDKYKLTTLQEIEKQLQTYQFTDKIELTFKNATRYLVEKREDKNVYHPILGTINQYLFEYSKEQRDKIEQFCKHELTNVHDEYLKCIMKVFILEEHIPEKKHADIKKYCNDYRMFFERRKHQSSIFFKAFKSVQSQITSWIEDQLKEKINNDYFLNDQMNLYKRFNSRHEEEFDWKKCCGDRSILAIYSDYIPEKGPLAKSYRELLAYIFNVNIRLYVEDQNYGLIPKDNHNPLCGNAIHILYRDDKFIELNINKNYVILDEERKIKDSLYGKIFVEIESLSQKQELDNYLENKIYLTNKVLSDGKQYYRESNLHNSFEKKSKHLDRLLFDKFKFIMVNETEKQLSNYQKVTDKIELTFDNVARYLVEEKGKDKNINHYVLGNLNQYLYTYGKKQKKKIKEFCKKELNNDKEVFKCSMRTFILEVEISGKENDHIIKYRDKYLRFLKKKENQPSILWEVFKSVQSQIQSWIEDITDDSVRNQLRERIENDYFLNEQKKLYERYNSQEHDWEKCCENRSVLEKYNDYVVEDISLLKRIKNNIYERLNYQHEQEYDWWKCCEDKSFLEKYFNYITKTGPSSKSFRELLAHIFGVNIRLYTEDDIRGLIPKDNHNSNSRNAIHILDANNVFIKLMIYENRLKSDEQRKKRDYCYTMTFLGNESLGQKQEYYDYLKNRVDLNDNTLSMDREHFEKETIKNIVKYFPNEEKQQLELRLGKLTSQYINQNGILCNLLKRFSSEGRLVSYRDLCFLISSILSYITEDRNERNVFSWIIAAYSQRDWINEVILLQLENYFKGQLKVKPKWREYLSKMKNKDALLLLNVKFDQVDTVSVENMEDILYLLSNIPYTTDILQELKLSEWPFVLREKYFLFCELTSLTNWDDDEKLKTASYYLWSLENSFNTDLVKKLVENLKKKNQELSSDVLIDILSQFYNENWILSNLVLDTLDKYNIDTWIKETKQKFINNNEERTITHLVELIDANVNNSEIILKILPEIKSDIESIDEEISNIKTADDIIKWVDKFQSDKCTNNHHILCVIDKAIELKRKFKLRDTQKLTVLALLKNDNKTLAQVSTGEGKSLIVVTISIIRALRGEKVDVITSSSVLAKRDAEDNRDIYGLFNIYVSHNCSEDIETRKKAYSNNQVVYGDLSSFQRDYLLDKFYGRNVLGNRNFENVIIDEVDSMLLDKGNNMLYLSHDIGGLDKLESVYMYIWQWINRTVTSREEVRYALNVKAIKEAVLNDLYEMVNKDDIGKLGPELSTYDKNIIWECLISNGILDNEGTILKEITGDELNKIIELRSYKDRLFYLLKERIEREKCIHLPNYLRSFVKGHLESWIDNAIKAFFMKVGQDYVLDVDRTETSQDSHPNIIILDKDTGTDQANSQWDEALHQFLQLKHGCKISLQSLKAVFISNASFFKLYKKLYGLSGTLGLSMERKLLREMYQVDFMTIPTAKFKLFQEHKPIVCSREEEWIHRIFIETKEFIENKKRSVLIICETVNDVNVINAAFKGRKCVHTYTRDYEEFDITQGNKKLDGEQIIIATNLAGRGTDIKITEELRKAGGLHICLTYLPRNIRIEQQAFGRAARCGDDGSGQFIIMDSKGQNDSNSNMLNLKRNRSIIDLHRTSNIKNYYEKQIAVEEDCFKIFGEQYGKLKKKLNNAKVSNQVKDILLQSCLDKWAFWLDENRQCIKDAEDEQSKRNLKKQQDALFSRLENLKSDNWLPWVEDNPVQMVKLGKYKFKNEKNYHSTIEIFDEVIKKEPYFSEAAHYYKALALLSTTNALENDKKNIKDELRIAARLFERHNKFASESAGYVATFRKNIIENIVQIDGYEKQKNMVANIYRAFSMSVSNILGGGITPQSFKEINDELALNIYKDLLDENILKKPKIKMASCEKTLKKICDGNGIFLDTLRKFLSGRTDVDEKKFLKDIKKAIPLPSKEAFWKILIEKKILFAEIKYVVIIKKNMEKIDPSLFESLTKEVNEKRLKEQTLGVNNEQILLNEFDENDNYIFKKDEFKKIIGIDKYQMLKEEMLLSFTKKCNININNVDSTSLSSYDSISINDLIDKANVTESDAEKILTELVERKVLEKMDHVENNEYKLKITYDEMNEIRLPCFPVYENKIKALLYECFIYRITLLEMALQVAKEHFPKQIHLKNKPHQSLVDELWEWNIIKSAKVKNKIEVLKGRLNHMYRIDIAKNDLKRMFSRYRLIPEKDTDKLLKHLVEMKWITHNGYGTFSINKSEKRLMPLNFESVNIDKTLKKILDDRLYLAKQETIDRIVHILDSSKSRIKTVGKLKLINEFENTDEMNTFTLNGLDEIPKLEKNERTIGKICVTALVTVALCIFAFVAICFCPPAIMSMLKTKFSQFLNFIKQGLKNISLKKVLNNVKPLYDYTQKLMLKYRDDKEKQKNGDVGQRRIQINDFPSYNVDFDTIINNQLQIFCKGISSNILSNIENDVKRHDISKSVKRTYEILGKESAEKMLNDLIKSDLNENVCLNKYISVSNKIFNNINGIITEDIKKRGKIDEDLDVFIHTLSDILIWSERPAQIAEITAITNKLLCDLDKKINSELENVLSLEPLNRKHETEKNYEMFITETIDRLKSSLCENVKKIVEKHIVKRIYDEGGRKMFKYIEKKVKVVYNSFKETDNFEDCNELKRKYNENLPKKWHFSNKTTIIKYFKEKYDKNLLKLLDLTKNPAVFATIIQEGIPMDMICVNVAVHVIFGFLKKQGINIPRLTIIIEGDDGFNQIFNPEKGGKTIRISLKDNNFCLCNSDASEGDRDNDKCLFNAILKSVPEMKSFTPEFFRYEIANYVKTNTDIQNFILNSLYRFRLTRNFLDVKSPVKHLIDDDMKSSVHITRRLKYYIYINGLAQRISEEINTYRRNVVEDGKFENFNNILNHPGSHSIRVNDIIGKSIRESYTLLSENLDCTDVIEISSNLHRSHIVDFQSDRLIQLANINFAGKFTNEIEEIIKKIWRDYIASLENVIKNEKYGKEQIIEIKNAIEDINQLSIESLFKIGKDGYGRVDMKLNRETDSDNVQNNA